MRSRLADIAARAGVSEATVSRVLNERPGVAAATRDAVLTAVDVLGYDRPVRLRASAAPLVGVVVPAVDDLARPELVTAVVAELSARAHLPVLATVPTAGPAGPDGSVGAEEDEAVGLLVRRGVAGLVLVGGRHTDRTADLGPYRRLQARGLPLAALGAPAPGLDVASAASDDRASMDLAVAHLVALGHRRIGLVTGTARTVAASRKEAGFSRSMRTRLGVESASGLLVRTPTSVEGGAAVLGQLLAVGATAVVTTALPLALGVVRGARQRELVVPRDLSVVGYDDVPVLLEVTDPPLTTLRQALPAMAAAAVEALVVGIRTGSVPAAQELSFRAELVVRGSTGAVPGP